MIPTIKESLELAESKRHVLFNDNTMIRLHGGEAESSYWLFQINGKIYIGYMVKEGELSLPYLNKPSYEMRSKSGELQAVMQLLKVN